MASPQFVVRYHWKPDTLAFWDNRSTMHFGIFDYEDESRTMHRVTLRRRPTGRPGAAERSGRSNPGLTTPGSE